MNQKPQVYNQSNQKQDAVAEQMKAIQKLLVDSEKEKEA